MNQINSEPLKSLKMPKTRSHMVEKYLAGNLREFDFGKSRFNPAESVRNIQDAVRNQTHIPELNQMRVESFNNNTGNAGNLNDTITFQPPVTKASSGYGLRPINAGVHTDNQGSAEFVYNSTPVVVLESPKHEFKGQLGNRRIFTREPQYKK